MCPDAYSFAFDDQTSTFIIPKGGGWEVVMCPKGRSTNILRQLGNELFELASAGALSEMTLKRLTDVTYIEADRSTSNSVRPVATMIMSLVPIVGIWLAL